MDVPRLEWHAHLVADRAAQEAFRRAIQRVVFPGAVVLDLGTGTGIHAVFACTAGARRVYAVDADAIVDLARAIARANGVADRIVFIQAPADEAELPEPVDVIVAHHGLETLLALVPAAARRFLKPGGRVIPARAGLFAVPVEAPDVYEQLVGGWGTRYGIDFGPARELALNTVCDWLARPENLLGRGVSLGTVRFDDPAPVLNAEVVLPIARSGELHGVGTWLVEELAEGETISTAPPSPVSREVWRDYFFPVAAPVTVRAGDSVAFAAATGAGGWGRLWRWRIAVRTREGDTVSSSSHSSLAGLPLSVAQVRSLAPDRRARLTPRGQAARFVLDRLNGQTTLREIEAAVVQKFGDQFESPEDAAAFVARLVARYGR